MKNRRKKRNFQLYRGLTGSLPPTLDVIKDVVGVDFSQHLASFRFPTVNNLNKPVISTEEETFHPTSEK